jgi:hypothetical protein
MMNAHLTFTTIMQLILLCAELFAVFLANRTKYPFSFTKTKLLFDIRSTENSSNNLFLFFYSAQVFFIVFVFCSLKWFSNVSTPFACFLMIFYFLYDLPINLGYAVDFYQDILLHVHYYVRGTRKCASILNERSDETELKFVKRKVKQENEMCERMFYNIVFHAACSNIWFYNSEHWNVLNECFFILFQEEEKMREIYGTL